MAKELPKRSEVRVEDTWAVEDIYPNLQAWEKDLEAAKEIGAKLASCQGKIGESAAQLWRLSVCMRKEGKNLV